MLIEIEHRLHFEYGDFIHESFMELRMEPPTDARQVLRSFYLAVGPPTQVARYSDWNGNWVHHFGVTDYHDRIEVLVRSAVSTGPAPVSLEELRGAPAVASDSGAAALGPLLDFVAFGGPVVRSRDLERLAARLPVGEAAPIGEQVDAMGRFLLEQFEYRKGVTDFKSSVQAILSERAGVCQDFAHLMLSLLRLRGVPCRYVSGYLHVAGDSEEPSQSHAWIEVHVPEIGWVPFDPTHAQVPDENYVVVARGRHYDDVPPNRGIYRGNAEESLHAAVETRISPPKDIASLQEEIGQLEVPVFREQPRTAPAPAEIDSQAQQQQ